MMRVICPGILVQNAAIKSPSFSARAQICFQGIPREADGDEKVPTDVEEAAAVRQPSSRRQRQRQRQRYASDRETAAYMGIGITSLWRLQNDIGSDGERLPPPGHSFPKSSRFNGAKRNDLDRIDEWMRQRAGD